MLKITKLITVGVVGLSLTIGMLFANDNKTKINQKATSTEYCLSLSGLSKVIMQRRQEGIPMSVLIKISEGDDIAQAIIMEAYSQPVYSTPNAKQKAIQSLADMVLLDCLQVVNKNK